MKTYRRPLNTDNMEYVFWQNFPSIHQTAHIRALAERNDATVRVLFAEPVPQWRARMGWDEGSYGNADVTFVGDAREACERLLAAPLDAVHVFSSLRTVPLFSRAFRVALKGRRFAGIMSEPYGDRGLRGAVRLARGRLEGARVGNRVAFVLAIGHAGVRWYERTGYRRDRIFSYGYFMEPPPELPIIDPPNGPFSLVFVGRCVWQKGIDVLLRALASITPTDWRLRLVGDGPMLPAFRAGALALGLSRRVEFMGLRPYAETLRIVSESDLLVLPSRSKDGWGAVVSEALSVGVPAICTSECGAADLVTGDTRRGDVVPAGDVGEAARVLAQRVHRGPPSASDRRALRAWSARISGASAANYLVQIMEHLRGSGPRPIAPWFSPAD
jgi:glycosyltransferase involved in cell wall biosynthesis